MGFCPPRAYALLPHPKEVADAELPPTPSPRTAARRAQPLVISFTFITEAE